VNSNADIRIRAITREDAPVINKLSRQLGYILSPADTLVNIDQLSDLQDHAAFVAICNEQVVGWVHAFETRTVESLPFIELAGLVVDEQYRSKGIGKLLVDQVRKWCAERKIRSVRVRSNIIRKEAHQFYLSNGFTEIKEQKVFEAGI
jgi:GNAT superfamily N-acetyltransferase